LLYYLLNIARANAFGMNEHLPVRSGGNNQDFYFVKSAWRRFPNLCLGVTDKRHWRRAHPTQLQL